MAKKNQEEDFQGLSAADVGLSVGSGAASGAALGSTIMPGYGTAIGAGVGALVGGIKSYTQQEKLKDAFAQQQALDRQLGNNSLIDAFQTDSALRAGALQASAQANAAQKAQLMGLTPGAAIALERQASSDVAGAVAQDRASGFAAAASAERARRAGVLDEFNVAQGLANNATSGMGASDEAMANLARSASYLAETKPQTAPVETPMTDTFKVPVQTDFLGTDPGAMSQKVNMQDPASTRIQLPGVKEEIVGRNPAYFDFKSGGGYEAAAQSGVDPLMVQAAKILETGDINSPEWEAAYQMLYGGQK